MMAAVMFAVIHSTGPVLGKADLCKFGQSYKRFSSTTDGGNETRGT